MSTPSWTRSSRARPGGEEGTGVVASLLGGAIFLILVLFAVQIVFGLYSTSVVTSVTFDAAEAVAGGGGRLDPASTGAAEADARSRLGAYAADVAFTWDVDADVVGLTVRAKRPSVLPRALVDGVGLGDIERTVRVRVERAR